MITINPGLFNLNNGDYLAQTFFCDDKEMALNLSLFYKNFLDSNHSHVDIFCENYFPKLEEDFTAYYSRHKIEDRNQNRQINSLTPIWLFLTNNKLFSQAEVLWENVLFLIEHIEITFNTEIHKGILFYYWSISAIENGELEKGYRLMGAALDEDKKTYKNNQPNTIADKFIHFDYQDPEQVHQELIQNLKRKLGDFLPEYRKITSSTLDEATIQKKFLSVHPKEEAIFLLNYSLARIYQIALIPNKHPENLTAGLLDLSLLFDIIRVISLSINEKLPKYERDFYNQGNFLGAKALSNKWHKNFLDELSRQIKLGQNDKSQKGLFCITNELLRRNFTGKNCAKLLPIEQDIGIAYIIRNHSAHNIDPNLTLPIHRYPLLQSLFNVLFLVIDTFYI